MGEYQFCHRCQDPGKACLSYRSWLPELSGSFSDGGEICRHMMVDHICFSLLPIALIQHTEEVSAPVETDYRSLQEALAGDTVGVQCVTGLCVVTYG